MLNIKRLPFIIVFFAFFISKNTNAQKINQFDANKQRTGVWQKYYPNNRIRYSGTFKNGKEIGDFKFYDNSNSNFPSIIKTFSEDKDEVLVTFYNSDGGVQSKGYFLEKNRVGKWTFYFTNGKVMSEEFYKDGKLDGVLINYYPNGKITEESFYKNGLKDGVSKTYTSDGVLIEEVNYKEGKLNGSARYFELNGNLKELGDYKDGKRVGEWEYYLDGEITTEKELKKNKSSYSKSNEN